LKETESKAAVRDSVLARVVDSVEVDLPERLVDDETARRIANAEERAARAGITLQDALQTQGWDELRFRSDARSHAVRALKSDLVLEAVAREEGLEVTEEDLDGEIRSLAEATGRDVKEVERILERSGQVRSLAGDIIRTKALDLLVESADVASEETSGLPEPPLPTDQKEDGDE
jgi:trigger factor